MQTAVSFSPDQSLVTGMEIMVEAQRATTLDLLRRRFARPLRNLLVFASDRPDGLIRERVSSPAKGRRAVLLGQGEDLAPREWNPARGYLFRALELPDFEHAIQAWFKLDAVAEPAMDQFAGTVMYGNSYGHSRLVELATALESYSRTRHAKRKNEWALTKLKRLAAYARMPRREIGSSVPRLKLLLASRNYYAHLNKPSYGIKVSKVEAEQLNSIRRGHALMQACLLREIGLSTAEARDLLQRHYLGWSIPR
jgi:HEPN superfamily Apea-like protein